MEFQLITLLKEWGLTPQIVILAWFLYRNIEHLKQNNIKQTEILTELTNRVTVLEVKKENDT